eukprot:68-Amphidinium_carterae.2
MASPAKVVRSHLKHAKQTLQLEQLADSTSSEDLDGPTAGQKKRAVKAQKKKEKAARRRMEKGNADRTLDRLLQQSGQTPSALCDRRSPSDVQSDDGISHAPTDVVTDDLPAQPTPNILAPTSQASMELLSQHKHALGPMQSDLRTSTSDAAVTRNDLMMFQHQIQQQQQQQQQQLMDMIGSQLHAAFFSRTCHSYRNR